MKIEHVSYYDNQGGAARAAWRIHRALAAAGVDSRMRVAMKRSDDWRVTGPEGRLARALQGLRSGLVNGLLRLRHSTGAPSVSLLPSGLGRRLNAGDADVVHLQWVCGETLSIGEIGRLRKPMVWTLHDMWAFCGGEHYAPDDGTARWRVGYRSGKRPEGETGVDIDAWTWRRKRSAWKHPIHIVTPSQWLAECVRESALMSSWPVSVIPYPLDTDQFRPWPKEFAREVMGLPSEARLILFGAIGGTTDPRKGWDLLAPAIAKIARACPDAAAVIFGQSEPRDPPRLGIPLHWMGHLSDDASLALLYSAADVAVVPSRQDNFPQTAMEAQACGCPVAAFDATGLKDVVENRASGYLARPYDSDDLATGILWILADAERRRGLGASARARAVRCWAPAVVAPQYLDIYERLLSHHPPGYRIEHHR